jgi:hypothetical protein
MRAQARRGREVTPHGRTEDPPYGGLDARGQRDGLLRCETAVRQVCRAATSSAFSRNVSVAPHWEQT